MHSGALCCPLHICMKLRIRVVYANQGRSVPLATNRYGVKVKTNSAAYFSPKMYKDTHFCELNLIVPSVKHENRTYFERETRLLT